MAAGLLMIGIKTMINRIFTLSSVSLSALILTAMAPVPIGPNDPLFDLQWSLHNDGSQVVSIDVDDLHTIAQKGMAGVDIGFAESAAEVQAQAHAPVKVAVIDFGVDATHPDLQGRISNDGWNFIDNSANMYDEDGHGTHVSGIIAANAGNKLGIAGLTPASVQVMPLKILATGYENFSFKGRFITQYAADAIRYATAHGAGVINMSLGWPKLVDSQDVRNAVAEAIAKGVTVVVAAGNDKKDKPAYPCAYQNVICVGALSNDGKAAIFSNEGGAVDVLAPGDGIVSTIPLTIESATLRIQGYELMSGTSQAAPIVAAMAAVLKSVNPNMSASEIRARLLSSGQSYGNAGQALYGLARLPEALHAQPHPVYIPDFKSLEGVVVDEGTLKVTSTLDIANIWQTAQNVAINLTVNGVAAGASTVASLAEGQTLTVPWTYQFPSLDSSSTLSLTVNISDGTGQNRSFVTVLPAARDMRMIKNQTLIAVPTAIAQARDWMGADLFGHRFARVAQVATYGQSVGNPFYFRTVSADKTGVGLQIYDSSQPTEPLQQKLLVPYITRVTQVLRVDVLKSGHLDWVITGIGKDAQNKSFFQFYFLGPDFKPLWSRGAAWQISPSDPTQATNIVRLYSKPGSWISGPGNRLYPSYLAQGALPGADNFDSLDPRAVLTANHLYYMMPDSSQKVVDMRQPLILRAVDKASLYLQHPLGKLVNLLPQSQQDLAQGRVSAIFAEGLDLSATMSLAQASSVSQLTLVSRPKWDIAAAAGLVIPAQTLDPKQPTSVVLSFIDSGRGSLTWTDPAGVISGKTPFTYKQPLDPVTGLIGAHNLPGIGHVWFLESRFNLIGFHEDQTGHITSQSLPIERDSSFPGEVWDELMQAVVVGHQNQPLPGVYVDSTLVRGNSISVVIWNPQTAKLERPLRYSMNLPTACLQLSPYRVSEDPSTFTIPLICDAGGGQAEWRLINAEEAP